MPSALGGERLARGARAGLECGIVARSAKLGRGGLVLPQSYDKSLHPRVGRRVNKQLTAPGLQGHIRLQAGVGAHQHELLSANQLAECVELIIGQTRLVGDPDRAMFEGMHRVLVGNRSRIHRAGAISPIWVVRSADWRRLLVLYQALLMLTASEIRALDAGDLRRIGVVLLFLSLQNGVADNTHGQGHDQHCCAYEPPGDLALIHDLLRLALLDRALRRSTADRRTRVFH